MQEFKPSNTKHLVQGIKGHAVLTSIVTITLASSGALVSQNNFDDYLIHGAKTSLTHLVTQTPKLALDTFARAQNLGSQLFGNAPGSFEAAQIALPPSGAPVEMNVYFPGVQQITLAHNIPANMQLSSTDYLGTNASPFGTTRTQKNQARKKQAQQHQTNLVTLSEINNFLSLKHQRYTYVENKYFLKNTKARLPLYERLFKQAAAKYSLDWRLVAAIAYQESVWDPDAVSPTGVRGMMMLTNVTAKEMGVKDRTDVAESIFGGTAYFKKLLNRIPAEVTGPNRELMALAAYNMGYGHLIAARELTKRQGGDNTSWKEVKQRLPLLQVEKYYQQSRYGYARGARQAMHYVTEIQKHYDMLLMLTEYKSVKQGKKTHAALKGFELARYSY